MEAVCEIDEDVWASIGETDGELYSDVDEDKSAETQDTWDLVEVTAHKLVKNWADDGEGLNEPSGEFEDTVNAKKNNVAGE